MYKKFVHIILLIFSPLICLSQINPPVEVLHNKNINILQSNLRLAQNDSALIAAFENLAFFYERLNSDSSLEYYNKGLRLARKNEYIWAEARLLAGLSGTMSNQGKFAEAFELLFQSLRLAEECKSDYDIARTNRRISGIYFELENYPMSIVYIKKALQIDEANRLNDKVTIDHWSLADAYEKINKLDSAAFYVSLVFNQEKNLKTLIQYIYAIDGRINQKKGNNFQALLSYNVALKKAQINSDLIASSQVCADLSGLYTHLNKRDSAIFYGLKGYKYGKEVSFKKGVMLNCNLLAELYESTQPSLALKYYKIASAAKDGLFGVNNLQAIQNLISAEEIKQKQLEEAEAAYKEKLRLYVLLSALAALLIIAFILYRNNRHKQKSNAILQNEKEKVESTLLELKSTQAQLIQSEKMASLGELTAGIAHEIQNPLNFVNNFSDVNKELLQELKEEVNKGNMEEAKAIASDLISNEEKINHHGKRADAIVKGMLQHSRTSKGEKVPTDINALADEYLRLSYQGLRAKDPTFNAIFKTDFDLTIEKINIVPQDIGRVLLNLYNNAFYAAPLPPEGGFKEPAAKREPTVWVKTSKILASGIPPSGGRGALISIRDNGPGIPPALLDKIFQPFFTTKPTGQGTGLGLSLSYDIVKAHGGEIKVDTEEGKGTEFIIRLPV